MVMNMNNVLIVNYDLCIAICINYVTRTLKWDLIAGKEERRKKEVRNRIGKKENRYARNHEKSLKVSCLFS